MRRTVSAILAGCAAPTGVVGGAVYTWERGRGRRPGGGRFRLTTTAGESMAQQLILSVEGPFSLAAAASFGFGPHDGRPSDAAMRLAFVADDLESHTAE